MPTSKEKVKFDPGFHKFSARFPVETSEILDEIAKMKQLHQKKFEFQKFEIKVVPMIMDSAAIHLGCILWGSYLCYKYKDDPREIEGNAAKESNESPDYSQEMDFVIETIDKLNKASVFYLKRPTKIDKNIIDIFRNYKEFAELNHCFATTEKTSDIKIPESFAFIENQDLDKLKVDIEEIIDSGEITRIIELLP